MYTLGIHDGSDSTVAEALKSAFEVCPAMFADRHLLLLPYLHANDSTNEALLVLNRGAPDVSLLGCVWVVRVAERLDASFPRDQTVRQIENHARFLTAAGWFDCLQNCGGDASAASLEYARRSRWLMSRSSNELRAGTNTRRILERVDESLGAQVFLLSEALDGSGSWHGLDALLVFLADQAVAGRRAPEAKRRDLALDATEVRSDMRHNWLALAWWSSIAIALVAGALWAAQLLGWLS